MASGLGNDLTDLNYSILFYRTSELKDALEKARRRSNKEDGEENDVDNAFDYLDDEEDD